MDNTIIPYEDVTDSSSEDIDDSSSDDEHSQLLSNNIGVLYNKFQTDTKFMNMEDPKEYLKQRNQLFTPHIQKRIFTIVLNASSTSKSIKDDFKLPNKNIIGIKILKSTFIGDAGTTNYFSDLSIPEIPEIACDKNDDGENIIARIPIPKGPVADNWYHTHQFLELSLIDRYFYPTNLDTLTFNLSVNVKGYIVMELSYLNENSS
tara:strand:- start:487 stop:1101 length:615 start_codon:yes stop_codon:yes gene_type:complete